MKKYISFAQAKDGEFFVGGAKQWQSSPQDTRQAAKDVLSGYLSGQEHKVRYTVTKETFTN